MTNATGDLTRMKIDPKELFKNVVLPTRAVRAQIDKFLENAEVQRLMACANCEADPDGVNENGVRLQLIYQSICRQQVRLMAWAEKWKAANPEENEEENEGVEVPNALTNGVETMKRDRKPLTVLEGN